jgi:hypothetical protein
MVNPLKSGPLDHGFYLGGELLNLGVTIRMPTGFGISTFQISYIRQRAD